MGVQSEQLARPGAACSSRTASSASPEVIEKPNFWSSCAVAMYSCVCASTPAVTRTITRAGRCARGERGDPLDLVEGVHDDPADSGVERALELGRGLVVAVVADPGRVEARAQGDGQLTGAAHVEAQSLVGDPARDRRAEEGLARVVDVVRRERLAEGPGARAEVGLVEHVRRRPVLGDQVGQRRRRRPRARRRRACARWTTTAAAPARWGPPARGATTARGRRPSACAQPASCALIDDSHALGRGDAEQVEAVRGTRCASRSPAPAGRRAASENSSSPCGSTRHAS